MVTVVVLVMVVVMVTAMVVMAVVNVMLMVVVIQHRNIFHGSKLSLPLMSSSPLKLRSANELIKGKTNIHFLI